MFSTQLQLYLDRANVFVHGFPASTVFYGEHGCRGDGANMAGRVAYARQCWSEGGWQGPWPPNKIFFVKYLLILS